MDHVRRTSYAPWFLQVMDSQTAAYLENPEYETRWYFKYFLGRGNCTWCTIFLGNSSVLHDPEMGCSGDKAAAFVMTYAGFLCGSPSWQMEKYCLISLRCDCWCVVHQNFLGSDENKNPFFLSVVATDADNHGVMQHRGILWHKSGNQRLCLPLGPNKSVNYKTVLQ